VRVMRDWTFSSTADYVVGLLLAVLVAATLFG
jgi:hypothetical protein